MGVFSAALEIMGIFAKTIVPKIGNALLATFLKKSRLLWICSFISKKNQPKLFPRICFTITTCITIPMATTCTTITT